MLAAINAGFGGRRSPNCLLDWRLFSLAVVAQTTGRSLYNVMYSPINMDEYIHKPQNYYLLWEIK